MSDLIELPRLFLTGWREPRASLKDNDLVLRSLSAHCPHCPWCVQHTFDYKRLDVIALNKEDRDRLRGLKTFEATGKVLGLMLRHMVQKHGVEI